MFSKILNKESHTKCPCCKKNLPYSCLTPYLINGPIHEVNCPNCNVLLRPIKHPVPFWIGFAIGFLVIQLSIYGYWWFIEKNFLKAVGFSLLILTPILIIVCYITIKKIRFIES